jgi:hypothetical protein
VTERWAIYIGSREMAKHLDDPLLGIVQADSKEQAEELAAKDGQIASRAMPSASLWAVRMRDEQQEGLAS